MVAMQALTEERELLNSPTMPPDLGQPCIHLRSVRQNNLKNFNLDLPLHQLIVITGPSGSGKSSLAFDTLFAEGQRRYIETFSPYARQFFDRMDKPNVDRIENIPPAIAIEQRNAVKTTRSTVGTMTEISDYMKTLWLKVAQLFCRQCGRPVHAETPQRIWASCKTAAAANPRKLEILITFNLPLSGKLSIEESLNLIASQGYQRLLVPPTLGPHSRHDGLQIIRVEQALQLLQSAPLTELTVIQDRLKLNEGNERRFMESCEQAYGFGKGRLTLQFLDGSEPMRFSNRLHCADCDLEYKLPAPGLFSFNNPAGACQVCRGFGRTISIDYALAIPDSSKTLAGGAIKPWQTGQGLESQADLLKICRHRGIPINTPFRDLSNAHQTIIIAGDPDYGKKPGQEWPRAWYGVRGYFKYLESRAYKMHVRVLLSRYRTYLDCAACRGARFQPQSLQFKVPDAQGNLLTLADFYRLPIAEAIRFVESLEALNKLKRAHPLRIVRDEVRSRLLFLSEAGLGYLTLDRTTRTLSGGEAERVNLATCLGTRLVNALFVLDEPSVGLHARDTAALIKILKRLRDAGNTVVVVEHEPAIIRAADQIVDLGPGQGENGGHLMFQGPYAGIVKQKSSSTGRYLSGRDSAQCSASRRIDANTPRLAFSRINLHNLNDLAVEIPLRRFVCLTGVSGSGKSTLLRDIILPLVREKLAGRPDFSTERSQPNGQQRHPADCDPGARPSPTQVEVRGYDGLAEVILADQAPLGKTPRSNPAVYTGAFDAIRELFAQTPMARQRGLTASAFSFNSALGRCEQCAGAGFEKIEMQFLSDVYIRCSSCHGQRYRPHILEVKLAASSSGTRRPATLKAWNIAEMLDATVDQALLFLRQLSDSRPARRAICSLALLQEVGLGYLRLGQPVPTLSGGECQRLKLVAHLAQSEGLQQKAGAPILFLFDEPTTGLHFSDIKILLKVFQNLVEMGHSLIVIEHNLDVINSADWIVDLGPEGGAAGGQIVVEGTPETVAACPESHTGRALRETKPGLRFMLNRGIGESPCLKTGSAPASKTNANQYDKRRILNL